MLAEFTREDGVSVVKQLRVLGFKYGNGQAGRGLYSPNWDRQLGGFSVWADHSNDVFHLNPSLLHLLTDIEQEG